MLDADLALMAPDCLKQSTNTTGCPDDNALLAYLEGRLASGAKDRIEAHLDTCWRCGTAMADGVRTDAMRTDGVRSDGVRSDTVEPAAEGARRRMDRYRLLSRVGEGAMGVVYEGYDDELQRPVALKFLQIHGGAPRTDSARLIREAKALAAICHPNVLTIYDAGEVDGQVFIAMEFVATTVRTWLRRAPRTWRDVLAVYIDAARGLAAAHDVGIVHRDFKPDNLLIDTLDRVRVADFGLAIDTGLVTSPAGSDGPTAPRRACSGLVGTLPYMAPEQLRGGSADPRSDQFSFCVSLYEGLYGRRPFSGATAGELLDSIAAGPPDHGGEGVPRWLHQVVVRGLALAPEHRYADLHEVTATLLADPGARPRRRLARTASAVVLVGAVAATWFIARAGEDPAARCIAASSLQKVWNPQRAKQLTEGLLATRRAHAANTAAQVVARLDAYGEAWLRSYQANCQATYVDHVQSEPLFDLRARCLQQRLDKLVGLLEALGSAPTPAAADAAVDAAGNLAPIDSCEDSVALQRVVALPEDPATRDAVAQIEADLARAEAMGDVGQFAAASALLTALLPGAAKLKYPPLSAKLRQSHAKWLEKLGRYQEAEQEIRLALAAAHRARDDHQIAELWSTLLFLRGHRRGDVRGAWELVSVAELALVRAGQPPRLRAEFLLQKATALRARGDVQAGLDRAREGVEILASHLDAAHPRLIAARMKLALALGKAGKPNEGVELAETTIAVGKTVLGADHPIIVDGQLMLADTYRRNGQFAEALARGRAALDAAKVLYGPHHLMVAQALLNQGLTFEARAEYGEAREAFAEALAILERNPEEHGRDIAAALTNFALLHHRGGEHGQAVSLLERALNLTARTLGERHPNAGEISNTLGTVLQSLGRFDDAEVRLKAALEILETALGSEHPKVAGVLNNLGALAGARDDPRAAESYYRRALAIRQARLQPTHVDLAPPTHNIGDALRLQHRCEEAGEFYRRAAALWQGALGPEHPFSAYPLLGLGQCATQMQRYDEAVGLLEQVVRLRTQGQRDPALEADARFALAQALWRATPPQRPLAIQEAQRALALYRRSEGPEAEMRRVRRWLRGHSRSAAKRQR